MVFVKQSLNHKLSLNLMSLNRDCTVQFLAHFLGPGIFFSDWTLIRIYCEEIYYWICVLHVQWTYCQNDYSSFFFQTKIRLDYNIGWLYLFNGCFFFLFYHQIKSKRNPREQRDKRKIASSVPIGWTQFTFSSQNVCWNGLALLTQHSLLFLISTFL